MVKIAEYPELLRVTWLYFQVVAEKTGLFSAITHRILHMPAEKDEPLIVKKTVFSGDPSGSELDVPKKLRGRCLFFYFIAEGHYSDR